MKNIVLSLVGKTVSVLSSLLIVPLTIDYVNPTQYGIWLTLSSIIGWITFFDLGLGNGFRNKFAEARAKGDDGLARQYLSTTYFAVTSIIGIVFIAVLIGNKYIDWPSFLNISGIYQEELGSVFLILASFFCLNMVVSIVGMMLTADQKVGLSSLLFGIGQLASLISIFILTRVSQGSLMNLALYFAGIPCLVWVVATFVIFFFTRYKTLRPTYANVKLSLVSDIIGLGIQFFVIYLCLIAIFQMSNVILSRELGPDAVTEYNIAYKYFNILNSVVIIILTPYWSAFTDAYQKQDYAWMRSTKKNLERLWLLSVMAGVVMLLFSQLFYKFWVGQDVQVSWSLSISVAVYFMLFNIGNVYMYMINGIGTIRLQLYIYVGFAMVAWPLMVWASNMWGAAGVVILPSTALLVQALFGKVQLEKLLARRAFGIWRK